MQLARLKGYDIGSRSTLQTQASHHGLILLVGLKVEVPFALKVLEDGAPVTIIIGGDTHLLHLLAVGRIELYPYVYVCHGLILARM